MKLISWNVNGLRACINKGFIEFYNSIDSDIFAIQETKMQENQLYVIIFEKVFLTTRISIALIY